MIAQSIALVSIAGWDYDPISFSVTNDARWMPTWQGTAVLPRDANAPTIDPRTYPLARIKWWYGAADDPNVPRIMDCLCYVRSAVEDEFEETVTITFASAEILLQDDKNVSNGDYQPGAITARAVFEYCMARLVQRWGITWDSSGVAATVLPATATVWKMGQDADSYVRPNIRPQDLEVFQDMDSGTLDGIGVRLSTWLTTNGAPRTSGYAEGRYGKNLLEARFGVDVESGGWADAVTAIYNWTTSAGAVQRKGYRSFSTASYRKSQTIEFDSADPGYDPTPSLMASTLRRGYTGQLVVTAGMGSAGWNSAGNYNGDVPYSPGQSATAVLRDGTIYSASVSRVQWAYPDAKITLGIENAQLAQLDRYQPLPLP